MGNFPRYIPAGSLVDVTTRTIQGRLLLVPSRDLNDIVGGILARALARYDVELVDFKVLSNHVHLLAVVADAKALADFMCYVNGNLAKEAGRLHRWREKFWSRRYRAIVISNEAGAQIARLAPLPCWKDLPPEEYLAQVAELVREIEEETRQRLREQGRSPMGRKRIMRQHPHDKPSKSSRSPAPRFHAATAAVRKGLELAFYEFRIWYRQAADELKTGKKNVDFPPGCFPPRLPFHARGDPPVSRL